MCHVRVVGIHRLSSFHCRGGHGAVQPIRQPYHIRKLFTMSSGSVSSLTNVEVNGHSGEEPAISTPLRTQTSPAATLYPDPNRGALLSMQMQPHFSPAAPRTNKIKAGGSWRRGCCGWVVAKELLWVGWAKELLWVGWAKELCRF